MENLEEKDWQQLITYYRQRSSELEMQLVLQQITINKLKEDIKNKSDK